MTLPASWQWVALEDLIGSDAPIVYGIIQAGPEVENGIPYIRPTELVDGRIAVSSLKRTSATIAAKYSRSTLKEGDIVLAIVGTIGKLAIVPRELHGANITQSSARLRPPGFMPDGYLAAAMRSPQLRAQFAQMEFGVAVRRLNIAHVRALQIPVAPINEQRRIVAKLDAIFEQTRAAKARLERLPALLEKLKRSILVAAFRGDLTADWRASNPNVEPASALLERIRAERHRDCESEHRARETTPLYERTADPSGDPRVAALSSGLPESWLSVRIGAAATKVTSGARGWSSYYSEEGARFIRSQDINDDVLRFDEVAHVTLPESNEGARTRVALSDILVTITGANVARCALVLQDPGEAYVSQHVALVRVVPSMDRACLHLWLISEDGGRGQLKRAAYGLGKPGLNLSDIANVWLPLPPAAEQREIVQRVTAAFAVAERQAERACRALASNASLEQAALAKAFRGELVPQDPADEPASVLLDRIRAARAAEPAKPSRGRVARRVQPAPPPPADTSSSGAAAPADDPLDLVVAVFQQGTLRLSASTIIDVTGLRAKAVATALKALVDAGQVRVHGRAKGTTYEWNV